MRFFLFIILIFAGCKMLSPSAGLRNAPLPDVQVRTLRGDTIGLASLYAKTPLLLSVYLGNSCPMCVMNLQMLSQHATRFRSYGWELAALSNDSPEQNRIALSGRSSEGGFAQVGGFDIALYSDMNHNAMETLGCYRRPLDTERHGLFLIDANGIVRFDTVTRTPFEDYEFLAEQLKLISASSVAASK
ncbi:MAG: hypothetical protein HY22_00210 [[Candidatus Thermochlorobacteriaceae] bacterium GBChlB]|nr:MAG: hypothetical protein HY22_00210 [[Candidatus Thermochlorobacteriaceae] bacterium GBChlB]